MELLVLTLCIIRKEGKVLLGYKKKGLGAGNLNSFGGKVEEGESLEDAAKREVLEECGLRVDSVRKVALLTFTAPDRPKIYMHTYLAEGFTGRPIETDEMLPEWYAEEALPYERMWDSDRYWLPQVLASKLIEARFTFDHVDRVVEHDIREVATLAS